jgi:pimeloyl-ACP methyl ester carboxylesterase
MQLETSASPSPMTRESRADPRLDELTSVSTSGCHRISYAEWGPPDSDKIAICVHGLTRQGRDFDPLALALVRHGYRVLCPDLPGRGRSGWLRNPHDYDLPQYVRDMVMVIARSRAKQIDWIGTSLGGLVGMQVASMAGTPVHRLVINDVGPYLPLNALARLGRYVWSMPKSFANFHAAEAYFREILAPYGVLGDSEWFHLTTHSIQHGPDGRVRLRIDPQIGTALKPAIGYSLSMWRQWDKIRCPVLLLRGEHSDLLPRSVAEEMRRRGPRAKLIEFPDCGHAPALLNHAQIAPVVQWITQTEPAES